MMNHDTFDRLEEIKAKTLVIHGLYDKAQFPRVAKILAEMIPNGELFLVENAAHNVLEEQWDQVYPRILSFLSSL